MKKGKPVQIRQLALALALLLPSLLAAQLNMGQYEDEAPLRSWNIFGAWSAQSLGLGGSRYAHAGDGSAGLVNPALLSGLADFSLGLELNVLSAGLFRYGPVNTGVVISAGNLHTEALPFGASLTGRWHGWTLALNLARLEDYSRPAGTNHESYSWGTYSFDYNQSGYLDCWGIALSRRIGKKLSLGLGVNIVHGRLERTTTDRTSYSGYHEVVGSSVTQEYSGSYFNGGLAYDLSGRITLALVFRTPYDKSAKSSSLLYFDSSATRIEIPGEGQDQYHQPLVLGCGLHWQVMDRLQLVSDLSWFNWSGYRATYFEEEQRRDFRDTWVASAGGEYSLFLSPAIVVPLRAGLQYDMQPMRSPLSAYWNISFGSGLHLRRLRLDAAILFGTEGGSGSGLGVTLFTFSLNFAL